MNCCPWMGYSAGRCKDHRDRMLREADQPFLAVVASLVVAFDSVACPDKTPVKSLGTIC